MSFHLLMPLYVCRVWKGEVRPRVESLRWVFPRELRGLPMPAADKPLIAFLEDLL